MSSASKLSINSKYNLYTNYDTISGVKVDVVSILNYEQAQNKGFSITNLAINEKVIDLDSDTTEEYLKNQLYYHCVYRDSDNNETTYLVWDDVIDSDRTTKLSVKYSYTLELDVNSSLISNLPTIENSITTAITNTYGSSVVPNLVSNGETTELDSTAQTLETYKKLFNEASSVIEKLASLKQIESLINYFASDDMYSKIQSLSDSLSNIQDTVSTISEMIS